MLILLEVRSTDADYLLKLIEQPNTFFDTKHYMPLADFKKSLGRHFTITLDNIDEDPFIKLTGRKKYAIPSTRSQRRQGNSRTVKRAGKVD
ncbi:hypothetical protein MUA02_13615 [Enterobacteriaceae bacterium H20N1]|uniref:Uncharacterized protein n=1 Tax=Dryocola boscaweniae TaxID=2925397 RepID=A0A9X3ANK3_9ENTR|nr:hypothetical protein [Dryocola boscaweniae]MCT4702892.1 hypothetical protein [Dryocola boscaweniae]MCT4720060.1 hypothetical protein [Dryocola boscaweniae]